MKPCETCIHFNMEEDEYCNVEAYVEDGKPLHVILKDYVKC